MKTNLMSLLTIALFCLVGTAFADKTGTAGMTFLKMDVTARPAAMAGSFIGLSDDASALFYNPAGLINVKEMEYISSYRSYYADIAYGFAGAVMPLPDLSGAVGVQVDYLNTGDMDETTHKFPTGTGKTFSASDLMFGVSYAQMLTPKFFVGGTVKYIREQLADQSANTFAADVGTYYDTQWKSITFGMSIRNFGGNFKYIKEDTPLPMLFVFGTKFTPWQNDQNKVDVLVEAAHPSDNREYMTIGAEYSFDKKFFVRAGRMLNGKEYWFTTSEINKDVTFENSVNNTVIEKPKDELNFNGTTVGFGLNLVDFGLKADYSFGHHSDLGMTHMLTLGYNLK